MTDIHAYDEGASSGDLSAPDKQEAQEWESTSEVQEIEYHVPVTQINTPPAARNGIHFTVVLSTAVNNYQLLLGRDYDRVKTYITAVDYPVVIAQSQAQAQSASNAAQILSSTSSWQSIVGQNSSTDPGAGGIICTASGLTAGVEYGVQWTVTLEGTVTSGDANNMQLTGTGLNAAPTAYYPGAVGTYQQIPVTVTPAVASLQVKAIAAASGASAVYAAQIIATPISPTVTAGSVTAIPSGQIIPAGTTLPIEHCDEVWVAATSANLGRVAVEVCRTERASA
jgi:hypothetical protein